MCVRCVQNVVANHLNFYTTIYALPNVNSHTKFMNKIYLKNLKEKAKIVLKNGFDDKSKWEFDTQYGTPYIKVEIHSLVHEIIKELSEFEIEA